ncbi:TBC1 domain family member 14-like [Macrosteles quadrilineatus]|uniref:TBC1 domain family member 14-like n=1 Tax=Macrosteles quadrilineatus TaxID=74068 RepID=UPI0023E1E424|nr:TBC1 domain family member 14-like [Macrosteles quadrilineatus]
MSTVQVRNVCDPIVATAVNRGGYRPHVYALMPTLSLRLNCHPSSCVNCQLSRQHTATALSSQHSGGNQSQSLHHLHQSAVSTERALKLKVAQCKQALSRERRRPEARSKTGHYFEGAISNKNKNGPRPTLKTVRLDELLDKFPLAYSPLTKQLLLIKPDTQALSHYSSFHTEVNEVSNYTNIKEGEKEILNLEGKETDIEAPRVLKEFTGNSKGTECDLITQNLHRVNTEASSFSSTVSSLSDISPSTIEDSASGSLLDHGDSCSLVSISGCSAFSDDSLGADSKKKSLGGFLSRNVFNWKSSSKSQDSFGRWKLFGKNVSPISSHSSLSVDQYVESDGGSLAPDSTCSGSTARLETRVASSSALIQLDRPANLPAKSEEEQARHRAQYQQILQAAKKKEIKEAKLRKKQIQLQLKVEEQLAQAIRTWTVEILPWWDKIHSSKKAQDLWWQGVPPCVRGKVWKLAIGNHLNLTHSLYNIYVQRAQDRLRGGGPSSENDKEASMELIQLDISRTFPHLCIFQRGGPYYDMLHCLLAAYVCYRPDVGYVQGMSFIAAVLILNMEAADAFVCFANLLDQPCHRAFFHLSQPHMQAYYSTYDHLFRENLPELYSHFTNTTLTPDLYLLDWIYTVFTKTMNLDLACRVWDVFLRDGDEFLFRTALGVLHLCQDILLQLDFVRGSQFLTRLPDDLPGDQLFKSIACIRMITGKLTFQDILSLHSPDFDSQGTCLS